MSDEGEHRVMTREYAELSLRIGLLAGEADCWLNSTEFLGMFRKRQWTLTPEFLEEMRTEALRRGVPAAELELPPDIEEHMPELLELAMQTQAEHDTEVRHTMD